MRKLKLSIIGLGLLSASVFALETITIAASSVPHAQILQQVKPILAKEGVDLEIKIFDDYVLPNMLVQQKQLDANYFQHRPYLAEFNKERGTNLVELVGVHIEPMGVYASNSPTMTKFVKEYAKTKSFALLPKGTSVAIPNDTTNEGRALLLLQANGLITIKPHVQFPTKTDIVKNPDSLKFIELDAAMLPRALTSKQVGLAIINSNYALQANLNPQKDAIVIESKNSPYVNIVVVRPDELNEPKMRKLAQALHSVVVKNYIKKTYKGAIVPAF